jgi:hypothetical protein
MRCCNTALATVHSTPSSGRTNGRMTFAEQENGNACGRNMVANPRPVPVLSARRANHRITMAVGLTPDYTRVGLLLENE